MTTCSPPDADHDDNPLPRLIYYTAQDIKNLAEKILRPYDLTIEQFQPLKIIYCATGLTQRQIGDECNKSAANLTRILDRLQKKCLIERRENPADRRASQVYLTSQGLSLVTEVTGILEAFAVTSLLGISDKDRRIVRRSLEKIAANLKKIDPHHVPVR
jgi:MarR family transcriptional regulator for hemolysin